MTISDRHSKQKFVVTFTSGEEEQFLYLSEVQTSCIERSIAAKLFNFTGEFAEGEVDSKGKFKSYGQ